MSASLVRVGLCLVGLVFLGPPRAQAQNVLSSLGRLSLEGVSLDNPRIPLSQRVAQARALGHLGEERGAVSLLIKTLARRPNETLRDAVVASLAERRSVQAVPELLRALRGRVGNLSLVCRALVAIGGSKATEGLMELTEHNDRTVKEPALRALVQLSPERAAPLLLKILADASEPVRRAGLRIAVDHPDARWIEPLALALNRASGEADAALFTSVAWALARVPNAAGLPTLLKVASAGSAGSEVAWPVLVAIAVCLRAHPEMDDAALRDRALSVVHRSGSATQRAALRTLFESKPADVAAPPHTTTTLRHMLHGHHGHSSEARAAAALALAASDDPKASVPLVAALSDRDPLVRRAAVVALARLDQDPARVALHRHAALEPDAEIAWLAALAVQRDPRVREDPWGQGQHVLTSLVDQSPAPLAR